jgi:O-acetyl-ADP-ribose deacetylase
VDYTVISSNIQSCLGIEKGIRLSRGCRRWANNRFDREKSMRRQIGHSVIELHQGDISRETVDAIVNAANSHLMGGGGVDGAIHLYGGPSIMAETDEKYTEGCPTGSAVISTAGDLKAKYVIHAVGPVWRGGKRGEAELLAGAYRRSLELAVEHDCHSIAFPALSTGAYCYPMDLAARIALATAIDFLRENGRPESIRFVLFSDGAFEAFSAAFDQLT